MKKYLTLTTEDMLKFIKIDALRAVKEYPETLRSVSRFYKSIADRASNK